MTKLFEILKDKGFFANDLRSRFKNGQILVNGQSVDINFELNLIKFIDVEDLIFRLCANPIWVLQLKLIGLDDIQDCNIQTSLKNELENFLIIKTSKKQTLIAQIK